MIPEPESRKKIWQRRPLLVGLLIILAFFTIFLILITFLGKISHLSETSSSSFGFGNKVAILKIEGVIFESEPVLKQLRAFRKDRSIKAVVMRVDSPGGAVAPSQEIYQELRRFKKEKPVVVSMGSVAASGGYYVCLPASYIYASPGTITGSIGVIMQTTNIGELLKWMKIREETIKSGKYKDAGSPFRSMTDEERRYFENLLKNVHEQFQSALKESRGLSQEKVEEVSDGRIFTGEQAKEMHLIDDLGNLEDAIKKAGELAGIKGEPEVIWPRRRYSFFEEFGAEISQKILNRVLNSLSNPIWYLEQGNILRTQRSEQ